MPFTLNYDCFSHVFSFQIDSSWYGSDVSTAQGWNRKAKILRDGCQQLAYCSHSSKAESKSNVSGDITASGE